MKLKQNEIKLKQKQFYKKLSKQEIFYTNENGTETKNFLLH